MANLFVKQAKQYSATRPTYPPELYQFIVSKTPCRDLVWDVGTGSGQAVRPLSKIYKNVVATDSSSKQLEYAPKLPNVRFQCTPPSMSKHSELQTYVAAESSVDLVTIAQAMHWFDLPKLYEQVKWVLKKPNGMLAAWCYTVPKVNDKVDAVFNPFYRIDSKPYWEKARDLVDDEYRNLLFSFEPVDGLEGTGPFQFVAEKAMSLDDYITYIKSWSAYHTAKENGVELLNDGVVGKFTSAWADDGCEEKVVRFPIYLRIGRVGELTTSTNSSNSK